MSQNILLQGKKCNGCTGCMQICPKSAISMQPDKEGFIYPKVDDQKCISCGLCLKACSIDKTVAQSIKSTFAAASTCTDVTKSASGGVFTAFAHSILEHNGVVFGSAMLYEDDILKVKHIEITDAKDLHLLQGSKYVQSNINGTFNRAKDYLIQKKLVLFSGTPCQIAGLRSFLQKDYPNLYTIDIICHGVPSEKMFQDYIHFVEKKEKKKIVEFKFRDKSDGWKLHGKMVLEDEFGRRMEKTFEPEQSSYYQMFLNSYTYRENCYSCPYAGEKRTGDITIGDYWCIDLVHPEMLVQNGGVFDEQKGVSCLIVNNEHGQKLLKEYSRGLEMVPSTFENASKYNGQLKHPSQMKPERKIALEKYSQGYDVVDRWYHRKQIPIIIKRRIRTAVPRKVKDFVKSYTSHLVTKEG